MIYIVLLRGINVGGRKKVLMKLLREELTTLGFKNVQTYIQSGNIVLKSDKTAEQIKEEVYLLIKEAFGFEVSVMIKADKQWQQVLELNPFTDKSENDSYYKNLNVTFLNEALSDLQLAKFVEKCTENESWQVVEDKIYFWFGDGQGHSKLAEYASNIRFGTTRNLRTIIKINELILEIT